MSANRAVARKIGVVGLLVGRDLAGPLLRVVGGVSGEDELWHEEGECRGGRSSV
ncbi:hypothetical protein [Streptomyces sp. NBC_00829]|uniref:hypothetical protein n=1 Tax=Streptomyces sp. NBC_00829 TaxID=2903679 RepID=UPI003864F6BB|nr:hypothetical protein OG293_00625 [Streptomyces sp. NBC_00829]